MTVRDCALIVGVGPGLGAALVRAFAGAGLDVALAARDAERLAPYAAEGEAAGARTRAYSCDVTSEADVDKLFAGMDADFGPLRVAVFNAGAFVPAGILDIGAADFERCWRIGCFGAFLVGQRAARRMLSEESGDGGEGHRGSILFTGATASLRGGARFANLAVGKFGLRALAQSMARELGPQGVHVAHVVIDGLISHPKSGGAAPGDARLDPDAIAANYLMLHRQPKSAWTHELDLRPWTETF